MIDRILRDFYNNVKAPSWPDIDRYEFFQDLPAEIIEECRTLHGLDQRWEEIIDHGYWSDIGWKYLSWQDLHFFPVAKCASTYYEKTLGDLGWHMNIGIRASLNASNAVRIGLMMDPVKRWLKGVTEFYWRFDLHKQPNIDAMIRSSLIPDTHALPLSVIFNQRLHLVNWIPMDHLSDDGIRQCLMAFFQLHGKNIVLTLGDQKIYESNDEKQEFFCRVKKIFLSDYHLEAYLYNLLANDIRFYQNLVATFSPDWHHILKNT